MAGDASAAMAPAVAAAVAAVLSTAAPLISGAVRGARTGSSGTIAVTSPSPLAPLSPRPELSSRCNGCAATSGVPPSDGASSTTAGTCGGANPATGASLSAASPGTSGAATTACPIRLSSCCSSCRTLSERLSTCPPPTVSLGSAAPSPSPTITSPSPSPSRSRAKAFTSAAVKTAAAVAPAVAPVGSPEVGPTSGALASGPAPSSCSAVGPLGPRSGPSTSKGDSAPSAITGRPVSSSPGAPELSFSSLSACPSSSFGSGSGALKADARCFFLRCANRNSPAATIPAEDWAP